jgi:hypothetical protein
MASKLRRAVCFQWKRWRNFLYNKKYLYLTLYLTPIARFVPARILFPKGEAHEDGQNWIEQFRVRFALHAQLFQGRRKGQAQRAPDNMESGGGGAVR